MNKITTLLLLLFVACKPKTPPAEDTVIVENTVSIPVVQKEIPATQMSAPSSIEEIRAAYAKTITQYANHELDSVSQNYHCGNSHGTVTYFYEFHKLRLIIHHSFLYDQEDGNEQYFIQDSNLFFAYHATFYWHAPSRDEPEVKTEIREDRVYYVDNEMIKCLSKTIRPDTTLIAKNEDVDCNSNEYLGRMYQTLLMFEGSDNTDCLPFTCGE